MAQFRYLEGEPVTLRSVLAHILAHLPDTMNAEEPMPPDLARAIGVTLEDICSLQIRLESGRTATAQLLITPLEQLVINHVLPSLSAEEMTEVVSQLFIHCFSPAFEATPGTSMVVWRDEQEVRISNPGEGDGA